MRSLGAGVEPEIVRKCGHSGTVIAPRRVLLTGDGDLNRVPFLARLAWTLRCWASNLTGRCI